MRGRERERESRGEKRRLWPRRERIFGGAGVVEDQKLVHLLVTLSLTFVLLVSFLSFSSFMSFFPPFVIQFCRVLIVEVPVSISLIAKEPR